jgi:hypothetical protein
LNPYVLVLTFNALLFILKHIVFGFDIGDFVLEGDELVLAISELVEILFEGGDDCFFLHVFHLLDGRSRH